jgi:hypothetical protein
LWVSTWTSPPINTANLEVDLNGATVNFDAPTTSGVWQGFSTTWSSEANTSLYIAIYDRNLNRDGNDFALDDISLQPVPEPSVGGLFVAGALALLRRKPQIRMAISPAQCPAIRPG